jgi:hypothetical protein
MDTSELKEKLHLLIDSSPEEKLIEVYAVFEDNYTDELKSELDREYADYQKTGEAISRGEIDKTIEKLLYGKE